MEAERATVEKLRQRTAELQRDVDLIEARVDAINAQADGNNDKIGALAMPEDVGDWSEANPCIVGIVQRLCVTHRLAPARMR